MDFFVENSFNGINCEGVYNVYFKAYFIMIKTEIVKWSDFWEHGEKIYLPDCMKEGSLKDVLR